MGSKIVKSFLIAGKFEALLCKNIQTQYNKIITQLAHLSPQSRSRKSIDFTGGLTSTSGLIAYQIGWGKRLIEWYETGIAGKTGVMPGDGFDKWDYQAIAIHFIKKYLYDEGEKQNEKFYEVVRKILTIVEKESINGNLDAIEVWPWCTLDSGKHWPLSKWVQVNTVAPYKKAVSLIRKFVD